MKSIRLTDAQRNIKLRLSLIKGGEVLKKRLTEMGLIPGEIITKIESSVNGPVILLVKGAKIAIGRGMADKIMVENANMLKKITIALAGNPNSGKTSIFNNLTGARQHVGNYPGVTVEKKEGRVFFGEYDINIVDL